MILVASGPISNERDGDKNTKYKTVLKISMGVISHAGGPAGLKV